MAKKLGGLGKGLNAIFIENDSEKGDGAVTLKISEIEPNRSQPRKDFDEQSLGELAESISSHGLLQPLLVRPLPLGGYEIVAGERRYRACRMAGLTEVPVIIRELTESETMELALIENLQREDLTPLEEAEGYNVLMREHGFTQEEIAQSMGKSRPAIANALRLLKLPESVRELLREDKISAGHARALLTLGSEEEMLAVADEIIKKDLSVRQTEALCKKPVKIKPEKQPEKQPTFYKMVELALNESMGRKVTVTKSKNKVCQIAQSLQEKASIPQVAAKLPLINEVADPANMKNITLERLEFIRNEMRDLVQFIFAEKGKKFTLNIGDIVEDDGTAVGPQLTVSYRQRVMDWLKNNRDLPVLKKLFSLEQLTHADIIQLETICWRDLGTKEEYQTYVRGCKMLCGDIVAAFIRSIIGIDREKASQRYADFLTDTALNPDQEEYLKTIISYVCENGDITSNDLINVEPFSGYDWLGVFGPQAQGVGKFVGYLHNVIVA